MISRKAKIISCSKSVFIKIHTQLPFHDRTVHQIVYHQENCWRRHRLEGRPYISSRTVKYITVQNTNLRALINS